MRSGRHVSVSHILVNNVLTLKVLGNVFPYYLRSLPNITVLQSLMDKDLSIACYAKVLLTNNGYRSVLMLIRIMMPPPSSQTTPT